MKLAFLFLAVFLYKIAINVSGLIRTAHYDDLYMKFLQEDNFNFSIYSTSVTHLFKSAGIASRAINYAELIGYGQACTGRADVFENMSNRREDVVSNMLNCFSVALGTYRARLIEAFSPLYWINCVIFLPSHLLKYLGVKGEAVFTKVLQVIYWASIPLLAAFRADIYNYITVLLSKL